VQFTSAGSGIFHSEYNASKKDPVHFLQICTLPYVVSYSFISLLSLSDHPLCRIRGQARSQGPRTLILDQGVD
jgi:hypothetical protein